MNPHPDDLQLLETHYTQSAAVIAHIDECDVCRERYSRIAHLAADAASSVKPRDPDWSGQRDVILRTISRSKTRRRARPLLRTAAAALLVFGAAGVTIYRSSDHVASSPAARASSAAAYVEEELPADPWEADELRDFHSVVEWQTWIEQKKETAKGGREL